MNASFLVNLFLKYLQAHPDVVEQLISALLQALIHHSQGTTPTTPPVVQ